MSSWAAGEGQGNKQVAQSPCCLLRPPASHQSTAAAGSKPQQAVQQSSGAWMTWNYIGNAQMTWKCTQAGCKASLHGRKKGQWQEPSGLAIAMCIWKGQDLHARLGCGAKYPNTESLSTTRCPLICITWGSSQFLICCSADGNALNCKKKSQQQMGQEVPS